MDSTAKQWREKDSTMLYETSEWEKGGVAKRNGQRIQIFLQGAVFIKEPTRQKLERHCDIHKTYKKYIHRRDQHRAKRTKEWKVPGHPELGSRTSKAYRREDQKDNRQNVRSHYAT